MEKYNMGLKMKKAKFEGHEIKTSDFKEFMRGNLYCIYCNTPVTYVAAYIKKQGDKDISVSPYFRLKNKKSNPHKSGCKYITSNVVKEIFADVSDEGLATFQNNKYIARLHIITESLEKRKKGTESNGNENSHFEKSEKKYIKNNEQPAYLNTIKKIVELKESLDDDKELSDLVSLQIYNENKQRYDEIEWKDFYVDYNLKQYEHIYCLIDEGKAFHPICFSGVIKNANKCEKNEGIYYINFYSIQQKKNVYLSLSILTKSQEVFDYANKLKGERVVIYGCNHYISKTKELKKSDNNIETYKNFITQINVKTQIFVLK